MKNYYAIYFDEFYVLTKKESNNYIIIQTKKPKSHYSNDNYLIKTKYLRSKSNKYASKILQVPKHIMNGYSKRISEHDLFLLML